MKQAADIKRRNTCSNFRQSFRRSITESELMKGKEELKINKKEEEEENKDYEYSDNEELYEKESEIMKEVSFEKLIEFKNEKNLTKETIKLMKKKYKV